MTHTDEVIFASWCLSDNFGDKLTPYIVEKLSGKKCVWSPPESDVLKYVVTGSILNWDIKNAIVWGAGLANKSDNVLVDNVVAVRGEISRYIALLSGLKNEMAIGDPALLLPKLYKPKTKKKYALGIFPHYVDSDVVLYHLLDKLPVEWIVINPLDAVEEVIEDICSCNNIISSSLHGLIVADAYKVPTQWVKFTDRILGDGTKFMDYYSSIGQDIATPQIDLREKITIEELSEVKCTLKEMDIDLEKLLAACPFKK